MHSARPQSCSRSSRGSSRPPICMQSRAATIRSGFPGVRAWASRRSMSAYKTASQPGCEGWPQGKGARSAAAGPLSSAGGPPAPAGKAITFVTTRAVAALQQNLTPTAPMETRRRVFDGNRDDAKTPGQASATSDGAAQQRLADLPLRAGVEGFEELHLASGEQRDRQTVAIEEAIAGQGGKLWSGCQDAGEVQRIGAGKRDPDACRGLAAHLAKHADRVGERELLAGKAGDKAAAADFAARFQATIDAQQVAPRRQPGGLALQQPPEHNPVTQ